MKSLCLWGNFMSADFIHMAPGELFFSIPGGACGFSTNSPKLRRKEPLEKDQRLANCSAFEVCS